MSRIHFLVIKGGATWDMTNITSKVKISGRKGSSSRSLTATLLDDDNYGRPRPEIDVGEGVHCIFYWDNVELFRGIVERQRTSQKKLLTITAHDNGIYLSTNKDTFSYSGKTASQIFSDVCARFGIPTGAVDDTGYVIDELPKPKTTGWDVITDALSLTYDATGVRFWPMSWGGKMQLKRRKDTILQWVIESGANLISYDAEKNIENVKTRIRLLSEEGTVLAEAANAGLEGKIGMRQEVDEPDDTLSQAQLNALVKSMLAEKSRPKESLSVSAVGQADVISGIGVFIRIPHLNLSKTYYVERDDHSFEGEYHSMSLSLVSAADIDG